MNRIAVGKVVITPRARWNGQRRLAPSDRWYADDRPDVAQNATPRGRRRRCAGVGTR
jgi:hypothetical protein